LPKKENRIFGSILLVILTSTLLLPYLTVKVKAIDIPRGEAVYMESWEDPTSFNPFNPNAPTFRPFLEPLLIFDAWHLTNVPWLAESYEWTDNFTLRVNLHNDTMWSDGQPLTTADVNYTFALPERRTEITGAGADLWTYGYLDHMTVVNSTTIDFVLNASNPNKYILMYTLTSQEIIPQHVWSGLEKNYTSLLEFNNLDNPVGSGPYKLLYASSSERRTIWVRNDNYWGVPYFGVPQPKYVVNTLSTSNELANMMFERGELDWSENFIPNIWELWENKHLARGTWSTKEPYYMPVPYMTGIVVFNYLHRAPSDFLALNNSEGRRAMAFAVDWNQICSVAFSKLTTPANPSLLPETVPALAKYINTTAVQQYGWTFNKTRANEILDNLGYHLNGDGWRTYPNGTKIGPYSLLIVEGWTDWEAAAEIFKSNLKDVGIDIQISLVDDATYFDDIQKGNFELTFDQPSTWTASTPWRGYYFIFSSHPSPATATPAAGNYGSYNNTRVDTLLDQIAKTNPDDEATLTSLYGELQSIILKELPYIIGWFYGPFYMYSTTYWTNWPNENNPYAGGVPYWDVGHGYFLMLFQLKSTTATEIPVVPTIPAEFIAALNQSMTTQAALNHSITDLQKSVSDLQGSVSTMQNLAYASMAVAIIAIAVAAVVVIRARRKED
jgi:peptide/nickel transport system substrate-binding protein